MGSYARQSRLRYQGLSGPGQTSRPAPEPYVVPLEYGASDSQAISKLSLRIHTSRRMGRELGRESERILKKMCQ